MAIGFVWLRDVGLDALPHLPAAMMDVLAPMALDLASGVRVELAPLPLPFPWPRCLRVRDAAAAPFTVVEHGAAVHRGGQADPAGGVWLRAYHFPHQPIAVASAAGGGGPRPAPGSLHAVALRNVRPGGVDVQVLQVGPGLAAPGVTMPEPFAQATVNGQPWAYADGQTIYLPRAAGLYRIATAGTPGREPRLAGTRAHVIECRPGRGGRILEVVTEPAFGADAGDVHVAWFSGSRPAAVEGGEVVDDRELTHATPADAARAAAAGFLVRFRPGRLRLHFGDEPAAPVRGGR
jgi:hypothetical protein